MKSLACSIGVHREKVLETAGLASLVRCSRCGHQRIDHGPFLPARRPRYWSPRVNFAAWLAEGVDAGMLNLDRHEPPSLWRRMVVWLRQRGCRHRYYLEDLRRVSPESVTCCCYKCGKQARAEYGLAISSAWERKPVVLSLLVGGLLALLTGCASTGERIVAVKSTVLGLDIATDASGVPHVRLGLIRYFTQSLPVSTNQLHAPAWSAEVSADVGLTRQSATETFSVKP